MIPHLFGLLLPFPHRFLDTSAPHHIIVQREIGVTINDFEYKATELRFRDHQYLALAHVEKDCSAPSICCYVLLLSTFLGYSENRVELT